MKHNKINVLPKRNAVKKVLWGLVFLALIVWIVQHPYEARHVLSQVVHAVTVLFSGPGR